MADDVVAINRAPVLTLWAAVVAARQGHDWDAALTVGKVVAGLNAQAKGRALGIFQPREAGSADAPGVASRRQDLWVHVCGRPVPAVRTGAGLRAVVGDQAVDPGAVLRYLERAFGERLAAVRQAMEELAASFLPDEIEAESYGLYERFRPRIAPDKLGWGQKGTLDLARIRALAKKA